MDGSFNRLRKKAGNQDLIRVHLVIESLETRNLFTAHPALAGVGMEAGPIAPLSSTNLAKTSKVSHQSLKIVGFAGIDEGSNTWTFQGKVIGDNLNGVTVQLGGLPSLQGTSVTIDAYGWFHITVQLQPGESGTATAQATDPSGDVSKPARTPIFPGSSYDSRNR